MRTETVIRLTYTCGHSRQVAEGGLEPDSCPNADHDPGDWPRGRLVHRQSRLRAGHDPVTCRDGDHYGQCSGVTR